MGCGDHPHIHGHGPGSAHWVDHAFLQNPQEFDLQFQWQVADFIEEYRAVVRQFKTSHPVGHRAGERAFFVAKELALDEVLGDGRAIDGNEIGASTRREFVQRARHDFFAGSALAGDEYGGVGRRDHGQQIANRFDRVAFTDKIRHVAGFLRSQNVCVRTRTRREVSISNA